MASDLTKAGAAFNHPLIVAPANIQSGSAPALYGPLLALNACAIGS